MVSNREQIVFLNQFFNHLLARKGFCMQQNDIAVLRRCQRFFLLGLLFYDDASDFFLRDCNFTTVPGQLFLFFDMKHKSLHCKVARIAVLRQCQAKIFDFLHETQESPLVKITEHAIIDW